MTVSIIDSFCCLSLQEVVVISVSLVNSSLNMRVGLIDQGSVSQRKMGTSSNVTLREWHSYLLEIRQTA